MIFWLVPIKDKNIKLRTADSYYMDGIIVKENGGAEKKFVIYFLENIKDKFIYRIQLHDLFSNVWYNNDLFSIDDAKKRAISSLRINNIIRNNSEIRN